MRFKAQDVTFFSMTLVTFGIFSHLHLAGVVSFATNMIGIVLNDGFSGPVQTYKAR